MLVLDFLSVSCTHVSYAYYIFQQNFLYVCPYLKMNVINEIYVSSISYVYTGCSINSAKSDSSLGVRSKCPNSYTATTYSFREKCERDVYDAISGARRNILETCTTVFAYVYVGRCSRYPPYMLMHAYAGRGMADSRRCSRVESIKVCAA